MHATQESCCQEQSYLESIWYFDTVILTWACFDLAHKQIFKLLDVCVFFFSFLSDQSTHEIYILTPLSSLALFFTSLHHWLPELEIKDTSRVHNGEEMRNEVSSSSGISSQSSFLMLWQKVKFKPSLTEERWRVTQLQPQLDSEDKWCRWDANFPLFILLPFTLPLSLHSMHRQESKQGLQACVSSGSNSVANSLSLSQHK